MATLHEVRPAWYTNEDDSAWDRIKAAFRRDWQQTKHDFGGNEPDLNQGVGDTVAQAAGSKPIPPGQAKSQHVDETGNVYVEQDEPAYKYGYSAYRHFGTECDWCDDTESRLRRDWADDADWAQKRCAVKRGWQYAREHRRP